MRFGGGTGAAAQHQLVAHEFSVVLTQHPFGASIAGIGGVSARCPFPHVAEHLRVVGGSGMETAAFEEISADWFGRGGDFPFRFSREARSGPLRVSVSF